jgi:hypothetical protein
MGDGGVYLNGKNCYFVMNMVKANDDYVRLVQSWLEQVTSTRVKEVDKGEGRQIQLRLESSTHPYFTKLRERIYTGTYKGIDPHACKMLDWEALAILFMCDGSGSRGEITLNLKRLSYGDQLFLKQLIRDRLGIEFNVNRQNQYYYLRLRAKDRATFVESIREYLTPSFLYKLSNVKLSSTEMMR